MKAKAFSFILTSFIFGIWMAPLLSIDLSIVSYLFFGFFVLAIIFFRNIYLGTLFLIFAIFFLAIFRYDAVQPINDSNWLGHYNEKEVEIVGIVDSEPEKDKATKIIIDVLSIDKKKDVYGKVLVTINNYPAFKFGEKVKVKGRIKEPPEFEDFSYQNYLSRYGIYSLMSFPEIEKTKSQFVKRNFIENMWFKTRLNLSKIKIFFESNIENVIPEPNASFMNGLILGSRKAIPEWLLDDFRITGTTHIIALSGFNITIIVMILKNLTQSLSRRLSFWLPVSGVFLFVVLTGAQASVVRAAIMGLMLFLAGRFGRQGTGYTAILISAALMIFLNPLILRFDIGFQLSFAAILGLIYVAPILEEIFKRAPKIINENLSLTLAAQFTAAPIIIYNFENFSFIAPIANILILPLIPISMLLGFLSAIFSFIFAPLGKVLGWAAYVLLEYMIRVVGYLSEIPFASIDLDFKHPIYLIIYCLIILNIYLIISYRNKKALNER